MVYSKRTLDLTTYMRYPFRYTLASEDDLEETKFTALMTLLDYENC